MRCSENPKPRPDFPLPHSPTPHENPRLLFTLLFAVPFLRADDYEARVFTGPDGSKLPYRLLTPPNYDSAKKYPLLVFLHGSGARGDNNTAQLTRLLPIFAKPETREKYPAFVFAPQCPKAQSWAAIEGKTDPLPPFAAAPTPPMQLVLGAIDALEKEFPIDTDRPLRHRILDGRAWHLGFAVPNPGSHRGGGADLRPGVPLADRRGEGRGDLGSFTGRSIRWCR
ncbi:MAG: hypothetical protein WDN28_10080 [Chthoniobacter sp.]